MKNLHTLAAVAVIITLAIPMSAVAKEGKYTDKAGRFGIGYDRSLAQVGGLSARFQVAKNFGIQAIASFDRTGIDINDAGGTTQQTFTKTNILVALRGDVGLAFTNRTSFGVIFGVNIFNGSEDLEVVNNSAGNVSDSQTQFAFEAGLKAEHHFTDWFSVHGEVGFVFALVSKLDELATLFSDPSSGVPNINATSTDGSAGDIDGSVIRFGVGDSFGSFGFTFWFN